MANKVGALLGALGFGFLVTRMSSAKPAVQSWQFVLLLKPPIVEDDTGDAEDAVRNGVSSEFTKAGGFVRSYEVSDKRDVITLLVEYDKTPNIAPMGSTFPLPGKTTATLLSAFKHSAYQAST